MLLELNASKSFGLRQRISKLRDVNVMNCFIGDLVHHYASEYVGSAGVDEFNGQVRDAFKMLGVTKEEMGFLTVRPEAL